MAFSSGFEINEGQSLWNLMLLMSLEGPWSIAWRRFLLRNASPHEN
jgi:hypothetical protein